MPPDEKIFRFAFSISHAFAAEKARALQARENRQSGSLVGRKHPTRAVVERAAV
jgi:hypothetical protein